METEFQPHPSHPSYPSTLREIAKRKRMDKTLLRKHRQPLTCCSEPTLPQPLPLNTNPADTAGNSVVLLGS